MAFFFCILVAFNTLPIYNLMIKRFFTILPLFLIFNLNAQSKEEKVRTLFQFNGFEQVFNDILNRMIAEQKSKNPFAEADYWTAYKTKAVKLGLNKIFLESMPKVYEIYSEKELNQLIEIYKNDKQKLLSDKQTQLTTTMGPIVSGWSEYMYGKLDAVTNRSATYDFSIESIQFEEVDPKTKTPSVIEIVNKDDLLLDTEHNLGTYLIDFGDVTDKENIVKHIEVKNVSDVVIELTESLFPRKTSYEVTLEKKFVQPGETVKILVTYKNAIISGRMYNSETIGIKEHNTAINFGVKIQGSDTRKIEVRFDKETKEAPNFATGYSDPIVFNFTNTGQIPLQVMNVDSDNEVALITYSKSLIQPNEKGKIFVVLSTEAMEVFKKTSIATNLTVEFKKENEHSFSNHAVETIKLSIKE